MNEAKKSLNEEQLRILNEVLEAQKKAKQERMQYNLDQQFKRIDAKILEQKNKNK